MTELTGRRELLKTAGFATLTATAAAAVSVATPEPAFATDPPVAYTDQGGQVFNVKNAAYGAKADTVRSSAGGAIAAGSTTFTQTAAVDETTSGALIAFASTDVGKVVTVQGAGPSGGVLSTTISAVVSTSTVTLAAAASTAVSDAAFAYGTDDTAAIVSAITTAGDTGTVYLPAGIYTIRGASNSGNPIRHVGRGGLRGRGGKSVGADDPQQGANTVLLCSDTTAGLIANGCARYESFLCDGNNIATRPLQNGEVASGAVTSAGSQATFIDVWAAGSAGTGWSIYGARNNSYYECGTANNALDGLLVDGGASGLLFFHFRQSGDLRYGIRADHAVAASGGSTQPTSRIRFVSGLFGDGDGRPAGVSTLHLRNAVDWRFPLTTVLGGNLAGPTVDLSQAQGHSIDLSQCWVSASAGYACIRITGTPTDTKERLFLKLDGCHLSGGDSSVDVQASPAPYRYSAVGGWRDTTTGGPVAAAGVPAIDTLFDGRTGAWQTATALAPWSGTVSYRVMAERWVEMKGTVTYSGSGSGAIFTLPVGYRPPGATRRVPAAASSGLAVVLMTSAGDVSAAPVGAAAFPASATVRLDGVSFPIGGA